MNVHLHSARIGLFAITILAGAASHAGVLMESVERNTQTGKDTRSQSMRLQNGSARIEAGNGNTISIFKDDALYVLDTQRKSYMVMDKATVERTANTMNEAMERMRAQMTNMPPEQRAMMENMLKQRGVPMPGNSAKPVKYDATATGASATAAGRSCKVWNVTRDGELWQQLCVVPYASLPGKDEFQALADRMRTLLSKLTESFGKQFADNPLQQAPDLTAKLNGVPFITRRYRNGTLDPNEIVVTAWKSQNVSATQFDIPSGYTKQEMPNLGNARSPR